MDTEFTLVPPSQLVIKASKRTIRDVLDRIISKPSVFTKIGPYLQAAPSVTEGHKVMNQLRIVEIVRKYDADGDIAAFHMNSWELWMQINTVLHRYYVFDSKGVARGFAKNAQLRGVADDKAAA